MYKPVKGLDSVTFEVLPHNGGYILKHISVRDITTSFDLFVRTATQAAEILRTFTVKDTIATITTFLVRRGSPLRTLIKQAITSKSPKKPRKYAVSNRAPGGGDIIDFRAYESRRKAIVREQWGRCAALEGGIMWRLAVDSVGIDEAVRVALKGPSVYSHKDGIIINIPHGDRYVRFVDDCFDAHERLILCGQYAIPSSTYRAKLLHTQKQN